MEVHDKVYMLVMRFQKNNADGSFEKENSGTICYSMEETLKQLYDYLERELWYFRKYDRKMDKASVKDLIYSMHTETCSCELFINEYSARREKIFSQKALHQRFKEVTANPSENLYEELLALVDHQRYYVNSFGEITRVITVPQKIAGQVVGVGTFTREDCKKEFYGGEFKYLDGTAMEEEKTYDGNLYFGCVNILRQHMDEKNHTGWERYKECFYSEEEALQGALAFYENKMEEYVPDGNGNITKELLKEIARKKVTRNFISVEVVSPKRKQFRVLKDMSKYYADHILSVKLEERYDFLLSLLRYDERFYNEDGEYLRTENKHQFMEDQYNYMLLPKFSRKNVKSLNYKV